ncbi:MAG TPA: transcriptional regulator [Xanthobacteraceae bacterium]|nr:transcriptional regulator [Xanthobacteraceae bacterium]
MKPSTLPDFVGRARAAHGDPLPDWLLALAEACTASSQTAVGRQLGVSGSFISQALGNTYQAGTAGLEAKVRAVLMRRVVESCPVAGRISGAECVRRQSAAFDASDPVGLRFFRACRGGCPHSRLKPKGEVA